ncbi:MAG: TetR/AcrR family transcriptional regulator [Gammaproteobacteria bacterium]
MDNEEIDLEPQQERSRRTLARLIQATAVTLMEHGLEGATIPRIAEVADVSPATVYRRFKDKKDLLRVAILHVLEGSNVGNRALLVKKLARPSLAEAARQLVELNFDQFRKNGQFMGALKQFLESDEDPRFVKDARRAISVNLDLVIKAMLAYRKEIPRPNPERALRLAVLMTSQSIESFCLSTRSQWATLQPIEDAEMVDELTRAFVAYLKHP